ncbi:hypothetical protein LguiA_003061 [Lonicera macranthoides]
MLEYGYTPNTYTLNIVMDVLFKIGRVGISLRVLKEIQTRWLRLGYSPNVVTCTSLIKGFLESQMPGSAFRILNNLESKGYSPDLVLCNVLIDGLSKIGRYDDALGVFFSLPKRKLVPDSYIFCSIISAVCLSRQFALLPLLVSRYIIQADLIICNSILNYFCKAGYPSATVEFYNDMID